MNSITDLLTSDNEHYDSQIVPGFNDSSFI